VFGFSFSELVVVIVVALVVIGPKDLPKMLRKLGKWAGKLRRMASDLRAQSGIDDALRAEGLADDIAEIRKLARGELDAVQRAARVDLDGAETRARDGGSSSSSSSSSSGAPNPYDGELYVVREREYPRDGADSYGALPDNAIVYAEGLPRSPLGNDPLYVTGDPNGVVPEEKKPEPPAEDEAGEAGQAAEAAEASEASDATASAVDGAPPPGAEPRAEDPKLPPAAEPPAREAR
jgi:sec-independent protein translocase protein TatB